MSGPFSRLDPAVQHHIVNSLGWRSLRPLQERSIEPVLAGHHCLLGAPTAGGKTEAALFPLLSRMVQERWSGLSVLYVCPLRALLNNLLPRISSYASLLGRTAAMWHGDVGDRDRRAIQRDPPDVLLTTPESLEAMFLSRRVDQRVLLGHVQAVVVDEIHAFAGDDRGWHLQAMLARLDELTGHEIQRIGLTATVGNPDWLAGWLASGGQRPATPVMVRDEAPAAPELVVDWVGTVANAATVIARMHRGEKRLVFVDSRSRAEELAAALRAQEVTVFVSHSSLSREDRRAAEQAFAETRDCVIVATSTLELGIDVGDLDRVIQLGAPATVASLQQRMGRTGRRPGTRKNCLFLATSTMELLQALALCSLVERGWVEPLAPPPRPTHLLVQQLLARVLADGRVGRSAWPGVTGRVAELAGVADLGRVVLDHMVDQQVLFDDGGLVSIGEVGERRYGRRHFMDVTSLFLTVPLLTVRWGPREIGTIDPSSLQSREGQRPVILLGGRAWAVESIEWNRRIVWASPAQERGRSRWTGGAAALSAEVCDAIRDVVAGALPPGTSVSTRATDKLAAVRADELPPVRPATTSLVWEVTRDRSTWWTFAGGRANRVIAEAAAAAGIEVLGFDDLDITMAKRPSTNALRAACDTLDAAAEALAVSPGQRQAIKFGDSLPDAEVDRIVRARSTDPAGAAVAARLPIVRSDDDR